MDLIGAPGHGHGVSCRNEPWVPPWAEEHPPIRQCSRLAAHAVVGCAERGMAMIVRDLMSADVRTCGPQDSLRQAAELMWNRDCGSLPVIDGEGHVVGMITDRDVCMHALMSNRPLQECTVADAMSSDVCSCGASDSVEAAQSLMRSRRVRRLPVIDGDRHVIGILSLNDLALHVRDRRDVGVPAEAVASTLTSVSVHGQPQGG